MTLARSPPRTSLHSLGQLVRPDSITSMRAVVQNWLDGIEVLDDHTLVFHLDPKMALVDITYALGQEQSVDILSKAHFEAEGEDGVLQKPVGTGPYEAVERLEGSHVLYERVPYDHWRINPDFEEVQIFFAAEAATRMAMILTSEAHAALLPPDLRLEAESRGMKTIRSTIVNTAIYMMFGGNLLPSKPEYDPTVPTARQEGAPGPEPGGGPEGDL